jgi:hypothetical protein
MPHIHEKIDFNVAAIFAASLRLTPPGFGSKTTA